MPDLPDLRDLCAAAVAAADDGEALEAFAEEGRATEVRAHQGEVEALEFSETRGVGIRVIADGRLGYAWVADPSLDEVRTAVATARENARFATQDDANVLPEPQAFEPIEALYSSAQAGRSTEAKVALALDLEARATSLDPRVRKVEEALYGDETSRVALASTTGVEGTYERTDCWCVVATLAEEADETQAGFAFRLARNSDDLAWSDCADEAVERAARLLGSKKPPSARVPVILDPHVATSFLGVLAGALTADAVQKGRSLFAERLGDHVGSDHVDLVDDGRLLDGTGAAPFDGEGVPTGRTALLSSGVLRGFLHNTYTAHRGSTMSTGNASRGGYTAPPGVGTTNLVLAGGDVEVAELLRRAEGGVYIQDISGVHSGTNPISGEFSVGATGLRIRGGALAEPLREMTVASTITDMLLAIDALGSDVRFFGSTGAPSVLVGEMTIAGV